MTKELKPWAIRPFELIFHAELHNRSGTDYDRRLALISFDNSIEVSITTYLKLHPKQRNGKTIPNVDVTKWLHDYHTKLDFFYEEIKSRGLPENKSQADIIWYHDQRNDSYHGHGASVPAQKTINEIRLVAIWIFSVLFEIPDADVNAILDMKISQGELVMKSIPDTFAVPDITQEQISALTVATIIGNWDEKNENDREIIRRIADGF